VGRKLVEEYFGFGFLRIPTHQGLKSLAIKMPYLRHFLFKLRHSLFEIDTLNLSNAVNENIIPEVFY